MDAEELYGLPLDRFVPERTALARALRADGAREQAAEVAKLGKPTLAAWAVNQLVRTQRRAVAELFAAGDALARAQADVVSGRGSAGALREASEAERASVEALVQAARGLLSSEGHALTPATVDRVGETLHAAALEPGARGAVEGGCLVRELRHVGMGASGGVPAPRVAAAREAAAREAAAREAETREAAAAAARELEAARERREQAATAVTEAQAALQEAEQALRAARRRAEEAAAAHQRAERNVASSP